MTAGRRAKGYRCDFGVYIGRMEKKMETTGVQGLGFRGTFGVRLGEWKMETTGTIGGV